MEVGGRDVLLMSVHLKCCGRIGDDSDLKRETETTAIRDALDDVIDAGGSDAVIMGGDFNLVGGRRPLVIAKSGTDVDGSHLSVARALQPKGSTTATWQDPGEPFVPGRLDFLLYADSALVLQRAVVADTRDVAVDVLRRFDLKADDARNISDHLPIVADFGWRAK
jgi:endonuclease/exonuclease/phosphatase family metal-dependent hydrolase